MTRATRPERARLLPRPRSCSERRRCIPGARDGAGRPSRRRAESRHRWHAQAEQGEAHKARCASRPARSRSHDGARIAATRRSRPESDVHQGSAHRFDACCRRTEPRCRAVAGGRKGGRNGFGSGHARIAEWHCRNGTEASRLTLTAMVVGSRVDAGNLLAAGPLWRR